MNNGIIISAPASGSGKTTVTLGVLRALKRLDIPVTAAKSGPDYIDPRFHTAACGVECGNLDAWAMSPRRIRSLAAGSGLLIIEGAMGLFDGAPPKGKGSTADLARILELPVVLVVDAARMAQSVAPVVAGFAAQDSKVHIAAVILNNVGSLRHERILRMALNPIGIPVLGAIPRQSDISHPSRHLGLVQASERPDLEEYLDHTADIVADNIDLEALQNLATPLPQSHPVQPPPPPAQSIAVARDAAFAFAYPHLLSDWRRAGAELTFFSPLKDQAPQKAEMVFLPGGYPELHAATLANASTFHAGMLSAAKSAIIYGECGGYMMLGKSLTDAKGKSHRMLGLLDLETSFEKRKLHLGYRRLTPLAGPFNTALNGHEFHYATTLRASGDTLFRTHDAQGSALQDMGLVQGKISGSFAHVIDQLH